MSSRAGFSGQRIDRLVPADIVERGLVQVPEGRQLFPAMTVRDNVLMGCYHQAARDGARRRLDEVLDIFPRVRERLGQLAGSLSGGEQQMVAIARGLMAKPQLLMLDEPSLGLGPIIVQQMFGVIDRICKLGATVLLVEQKAYHALKIADRGYVLENGRIALESTGAGLLADPHIRTAYSISASEHPEQRRAAATVKRIAFHHRGQRLDPGGEAEAIEARRNSFSDRGRA